MIASVQCHWLGQYDSKVKQVLVYGKSKDTGLSFAMINYFSMAKGHVKSI